MAEPNRHRGDLALLIDVAGQLHADSQVDEALLQPRDRAIGVALAGHRRDERERLAAWLARVAGSDDPTLGDRAEWAVHWAMFGLLVLGTGTGAAAALAVLRYDGSHPVNVLAVFAWLVLPQLALLLLTVIVALPPRLRRFVPVLGHLQDTLSMLSPGRLIVLLTRLMPQTWRQAFERIRGHGAIHGTLFAGVYKWLILVGSQRFAVGFNTGALTAAVVLIASTYVAFGWSTTLNLHGEDLHRATQAVSLPWWWLERARPTAEVIELTRYYPEWDWHDPLGLNIEQYRRARADWWPFLAMTIVVYGLLPRLILLYVAQRQLQQTICRTMSHLPGAVELRDRLEGRWVQTSAVEDEPAAPPVPAQDADAEPMSVTRAGVVINWAHVPVDAPMLQSRFGGPVLAAGGADVQADERAMAQVRAVGDAPVAVVVRAWEPPLLDLLDFIAALRAIMGPGRMIYVAPVGVGDDGQLSPAEARDMAIWRARLATVGDPWLKVSSVA